MTTVNTNDSVARQGDVFRMLCDPVQFDERASTDALGPVLRGHFAVFDEWTEIASFYEGNFMERFAPGAFTRTFKDDRDRMRVLFQHGRDWMIGNKPLGPIEELEQDDTGARYEVPLLDTVYVRELVPGLKAGLYGASFRFQVLREDVVAAPEPSDLNPRGIEERTVKEARVFEFGPVTFPAYASATAGVRMRGLPDEFLELFMPREKVAEVKRARAAEMPERVDDADVEAEEREAETAETPAAVELMSVPRSTVAPGLAPVDYKSTRRAGRRIRPLP